MNKDLILEFVDRINSHDVDGIAACPSNFWRLPAAWKSVISEGKIKHWQVYCDYKIIYDIIKKANS